MDEKMHHAIDELNEVHTRMKNKYMMEQQVRQDKERAKEMERYLRNFKLLASQRFEKNLNKKVAFQRVLDVEAMNSVLDAVEETLGSKYLFALGHSWDGSAEIARQTGADDVFEGQLATFLIKAGEQALQKQKSNINLGVSVVGGVSGNTMTDPNAIVNLTNNMIKDIISSSGIEENVQKVMEESEITTTPIARAGKTDVTGYSKEINISADIKPEWQNFIKTFQGANFSVKNYSKGKNQVIHLGNTNYFKAMYGVLSSLSFDSNKAVHIYAHTRTSYLFKQSAYTDEGQAHIIHIRFVYELAGSGLYDENMQKLDEVDFFIYNVPNNNNIFVRSVKEMIAQVQDYVQFPSIGNPWNSDIVVLKSTFNVT